MADSVLSPCACFNSRSAARAITDLYDRAVAPAGIRMTQFAILTAIAVRRSTTMNQLAADLGLDASTMTRTLAPLETDGLVASQPGEDRRARRLELTADGKAKAAECRQLWSKAQEELKARVGAERFERMVADMAAVTEALRAP